MSASYMGKFKVSKPVLGVQVALVNGKDVTLTGVVNLVNYKGCKGLSSFDSKAHTVTQVTDSSLITAVEPATVAENVIAAGFFDGQVVGIEKIEKRTNLHIIRTFVCEALGLKSFSQVHKASFHGDCALVFAGGRVTSVTMFTPSVDTSMKPKKSVLLTSGNFFASPCGHWILEINSGVLMAKDSTTLYKDMVKVSSLDRGLKSEIVVLTDGSVVSEEIMYDASLTPMFRVPYDTIPWSLGNLDLKTDDVSSVISSAAEHVTPGDLKCDVVEQMREARKLRRNAATHESNTQYLDEQIAELVAKREEEIFSMNNKRGLAMAMERYRESKRLRSQ